MTLDEATPVHIVICITSDIIPVTRLICDVLYDGL